MRLMMVLPSFGAPGFSRRTTWLPWSLLYDPEQKTSMSPYRAAVSSRRRPAPLRREERDAGTESFQGQTGQAAVGVPILPAQVTPCIVGGGDEPVFLRYPDGETGLIV